MLLHIVPTTWMTNGPSCIKMSPQPVACIRLHTLVPRSKASVISHERGHPCSQHQRVSAVQSTRHLDESPHAQVDGCHEDGK